MIKKMGLFKYRYISALSTAVVFVLLFGVYSVDATNQGETDVVEYNVIASCDFSGPYADIMSEWQGGREAVIKWWNETKGAELGVKIKMHTFDSRYDPAVIASNYPRLRSKYNPIAWFGVGGSDVAAIHERVDEDEIPIILSNAGYGYSWQEESWLVQPRPTYVHEAVGFAQFMLKNWHKDRPLRYGLLSSNAHPAYMEAHNGFIPYAKKTERVEVVGEEFIESQPIDLTDEVGRLVRAGADIIPIQTNTAMVAATIRALEEIGEEDTKIMMSSHNGLATTMKAMECDYERLEGHYEAYCLVPDSVAVPAVTELWEPYGPDLDWDIAAEQGVVQALLLTNAVERAVEEVGPENLTGRSVYEVFEDVTISQKEMFGLTPDLKFTHEAPFPQNPKIMVSQAKNGKRVVVTDEWVEIPEIDKW